MTCPNCGADLKHTGDTTKTPTEYTLRCECGYREPSTAQTYIDRAKERIKEERKKVN
jgi:C4-type Zn-finger protein